MPPLTESILELSPDSKVIYFDSGGPPADQPYTIYIFVHGALFNHSSYFRNISNSDYN